jgi:chromosome segregation ATPase
VDLIADILLVAGALGAGLYCVVLSRRLKRFSDVENGVGGAIAVLSAQVEQMTTALDEAQKSAISSTQSLKALTGRAEEVSRRLELLVASMHDIPETSASNTAHYDPAASVFQSRRPVREAAE